MKGILKDYKKYLMLFFIIISLIFLSGCNGITPTSPIINSFSANVYILDEGDSAILSWAVVDATTVSIDQGIGSVALSGSTSVSPTSTATYTLTATNSAGSSTATFTITVNMAIVEQTITIQPGPAEGKDSMVLSEYPDNNYGNSSGLQIGNLEGYLIYRTYLQFDISTLPAGAVIVNVDLKIYQWNTVGSLDTFMVNLHQITQSWQENAITWNNQPNYLPVPEIVSVTAYTAYTGAWLSWDISTLMQKWLDGSITNYGVVMKDTDEGLVDTFIPCWSSEYTTDPTLRPKLEITYYVP